MSKLEPEIIFGYLYKLVNFNSKSCSFQFSYLKTVNKNTLFSGCFRGMNSGRPPDRTYPN